jgi:Flp pilus assembly protein CpaB
MNKGFFIALAGGIFFGLLSLYAVRKYVESQVSEVTEVVIATADIAAGAEISAQQVAVVKYPKNLAPLETVADRQEVIHRVALTDIPARLPILKRQLAAPAGGSDSFEPDSLNAMAWEKSAAAKSARRRSPRRAAAQSAQPAVTAPPVKTGPVIELIEGAKRTRIETRP